MTGTTRLDADIIPLQETHQREDGTIRVKIIEPGWGSSGYYPPDVLEQAAPLYPAGLHMYWNHPATDQQKTRPERDLRDLAAVLAEGATYDPAGTRGPGLYARIKPFAHYAPVIRDLAPHIGLSHIAEGKTRDGEAEGRKGPIVTEITAARSVDFVTVPGAGGAILEAFREAAQQSTTTAHKMGSEPVTPDTPTITLDEVRKHQEIVDALQKEALDEASDQEAIANLKTELAESQKTVTALEEKLAAATGKVIVSDARDAIAAALRATDLPDPAKTRITETLVAAPPATDSGTLDETALNQRIEEAVKAETDYLAAVTEATKTVSTGGQIRGMGNSAAPAPGAALKEAFKRMYLREGKSDEDATRLAEIAARGR